MYPFHDDNFVKSIVKWALRMFIGKGLNNVFHACSMNHKQLLAHAAVEQSLRH